MSRKFDRKRIEKAATKLVRNPLIVAQIISEIVRPKPRFIPKPVWRWITHFVIRF